MKCLFILCILFSFKSFSSECETYHQEINGAAGKICDSKSLHESCFNAPQDFEKSRQAFRVPNETSEYVMICTHGLSDSPYYFKDMAQCLSSRVEFVGLRLAGHYGEPSGAAVKAGSWEQWQEKLQCAIDEARQRKKKVLLCGLSTGGVLSIYHALNARNADVVRGLVILSPAMGFKSKVAEIVPNWLLKFLNYKLVSKSLKYKRVCARYDHLYTSGVGYLKDGIDLLRKSKRQTDIPSYTFFSSDDNLVDLKETSYYLEKHFTQNRFLVFGQREPKELSFLKEKMEYFPTKEKTNHAGILKTKGCGYQREVNERFGLFCEKISSFVDSIIRARNP